MYAAYDIIKTRMTSLTTDNNNNNNNNKSNKNQGVFPNFLFKAKKKRKKE
jgi:hypothetical protein